MVDALKGVNSVMERVNKSMDVHSIREVLKEFAKQSEKMEMQQEMVSIHQLTLSLLMLFHMR